MFRLGSSLLLATGRTSANMLFHLGGLGTLTISSLRAVLSGRMSGRELLAQMVDIGVRSLPLVTIIAALSGVVSAQQGGYQLTTAIPLYLVGSAVSTGVVLELAPLMTAIGLIGRVGARITAELGTMKISEQIDALQALGRDPVAVLAAPRIVAGIVTTPLLVLWATGIGIASGMVTAGITADVGREIFLFGARMNWHSYDLFYSGVKAATFGYLIPLIGVHQGFLTQGGAEGVGRATTTSVVGMIIAVFASNAAFPPLLLN